MSARTRQENRLYSTCFVSELGYLQHDFAPDWDQLPFEASFCTLWRIRTRLPLYQAALARKMTTETSIVPSASEVGEFCSSLEQRTAEEM